MFEQKAIAGFFTQQQMKAKIPLTVRPHVAALDR